MPRPRQFTPEQFAAALATVRKCRQRGVPITHALEKAALKHGMTPRTLHRYWYRQRAPKLRLGSIPVSRGRKL
jgi:hypothetical protein